MLPIRAQRFLTRSNPLSRAFRPSITSRIPQKRFNSSSEPPRQQQPSPEPPRPQRNVIGVFSPTSAAIFIAVGAGLYFYFDHEKQKLIEQREKERQSQAYGRPNVGGPFSLTECSTGKEFTEQDLLGKWNLVYFGFTNCPDICPAELDKVTVVVDKLSCVIFPSALPIFISVDPARDTPSQVQTYLKDFHPDYIGLVGDYQKTKSACKAYRVYFSTPPDADPKGDYLVDHSIFIYLMDPQGKFVEAFGQATDKDEAAEKMKELIREWKW
ncbi:putative sco1-involved in stabilization of cox1p and cox2p [Moniliophthora roreri MCA 2997]|uniref:Sco1-involved in stabilization of cox1p and cox2p n=1 Tax=Moniliophthora roreri (strain MCA 2997) TaxID=1381753 RepID=V2WX58_MONRO|nr:putative sco1-involved in stabilization of cox1p and cox2p [Moniliophthora roreri MCA 2997]